MSMPIELPDWLEACRPDDALCADAYEGTPAELRALLKTAIAFAFHRWKMQDGDTCREAMSVREGFRHTERSRPAAWALASVGPDFASPARLLAALVPAILAGTGRILIVSEAPFSAPVIAALELAGLEDAFLLEGERLESLYEDLRALSPDGRIVAFPDGNGEFGEAQKALLHAAALDGMPRLRDLPRPRILCLHGPDSDAAARLRWLHPDADLLFEPAPGIRAAFLPEGRPCDAPFLAGPGMEACWPGPSPDHYRTLSCSASLLQDNDPEILP